MSVFRPKFYIFFVFLVQGGGVSSEESAESSEEDVLTSGPRGSIVAPGSAHQVKAAQHFVEIQMG